MRPRRPANLATVEQRAIAEDVLGLTGSGVEDDLPRAAAHVLELLVDLDTIGVLDLPLDGLPTDPDLDARITALTIALGEFADRTRARADRAPTEKQLAAREQLAGRMRAAARRVLDGQPDGLPRRVALLFDLLGAQIELGGEFGGLLWRRLDEVAEVLAEYVSAPTPFDHTTGLQPGIYRVIKRVVVDEKGAHYVDEPGGVPVAGLWAPTLTLIEPLPDGALVELDPRDVLGDRATVPRGSMAEVLEWAGENPGRARAALGVEYGRPDGPREHLVAVLTTTIEHAGDCVAVWLPAPGRVCSAAAGPNMPHRCVAKTGNDQHRRSLVNHECLCGTQLAPADVPGALVQLAGLDETGTKRW